MKYRVYMIFCGLLALSSLSCSTDSKRRPPSIDPGPQVSTGGRDEACTKLFKQGVDLAAPLKEEILRQANWVQEENRWNHKQSAAMIWRSVALLSAKESLVALPDTSLEEKWTQFFETSVQVNPQGISLYGVGYTRCP